MSIVVVVARGVFFSVFWAKFLAGLSPEIREDVSSNVISQDMTCEHLETYL